MAKTDLTAQRLREILHYDSDTGNFVAAIDSQCGKGRIIRRAGTKLGTLSDQGYIKITVQSRYFLAHRLAWLYVYGELPFKQIDHINGNRIDNRLLNLRLADQALNSENLRGAKSHSTTGLLGVVPNRKRWSAQIRANGKQMHLGTFDTPELAHQAYLNAKRELHAGCTI